MQWSKIKNIMLVLLICTNLILLFFSVSPFAQNSINMDSTTQAAIDLLEKRGISTQMPASAIPAPHAQLSVVDERMDEENLFSSLLGDGLCDDLGGHTYHYISTKGSVQCYSNGDFEGIFTPESFPLGDLTPQAHALKTLAVLGISGEVISTTETLQETVVEVRQLWQGMPILECEISLHYSDVGLICISPARRLTGTTVPMDTTPVTTSTALINFSIGLDAQGDVCSAITSIRPGYTQHRLLSGGLQLLPVWIIETDTARYTLDLTSGTLIRSLERSLEL